MKYLTTLLLALCFAIALPLSAQQGERSFVEVYGSQLKLSAVQRNNINKIEASLAARYEYLATSSTTDEATRKRATRELDAMKAKGINAILNAPQREQLRELQRTQPERQGMAMGAPRASLTDAKLLPEQGLAHNEVTLTFDLAEAGTVRAAVYTVRGQYVMDLFEEERAAGSHRIESSIEALPKGGYHVRLSLGGQSTTLRFIKR